MNKSWSLFSIWLLLLVAAFISYWLAPNGEWVLVRNIVYVATPIFATVIGFKALAISGWAGAKTRIFAFLLIGLACWTVGEILWVYYEFILGVDAFPSTADYFYLAAYPFMFIGLVGEYKMANLRALDPVIGFLLGIITSLLVIVIVYFGIYLSYDSTAPFLENIIAIGYNVADTVTILLALLVLILAWEFKGGIYMEFYLYIFFALAMALVADLGFALYNEKYLSEAWWQKNTFDSLWILGYLYWAAAFGCLTISLRSVQERLAKK